MRKEIEKILNLPDVEKTVSGYLISMGFCKADQLKYEELVLTEQGRTSIKSKDVLPDPVFIKRYRDLFPAGKKSSEEDVTGKMSIVLKKYTEEEVIAATELYFSKLSDSTYSETASYFISKKLPDGVRSTLREYLELIKESSLEIKAGFGQELL
jgi:hypothetical protein